MAKATVNLFFDTRTGKAKADTARDGAGMVKWLVCHARKQRMHTTGEKVTAEQWAFLQKHRGRIDNRIKDEDLITLRNRFAGHLKRAQDIVDALGDGFTFDGFAEALARNGRPKEKPAGNTDLLSATMAKAATMAEAKRLGNALNYELAGKSLGRFANSLGDAERKTLLGIPVPHRKSLPRPPAVLCFAHLTPVFLNAYERWMLRCGKSAKKAGEPPTPASLTTVGIYLRHIRAVANDAVEAGVMPRDAYPFGRNRYTIPAGANVKKALPKAVIEKIKAYQPMPGTMEQRSHDLWLFSYFCNGANMTDICRMQWERTDTKAAKLTFIREKTARSKKHSQTAVTVHLRAEALAIIGRWGTPAKSGHVFPLLNAAMDEEAKRRTVRQVVKVTNQWMKRIAAALGIDADVNTYAARHSYATTLLKSNAPLAFISKSLGHTNLKTTESYLGSFDDDEAKGFLEAL